MKHFRLSDPFSEPILPQYSLIGDVDVPLTAIFESRSQEFVLDVMSPHTASVVGMIKLALEPSSAEAPSSTLKFNVVMREMLGFAEREGTSVHAQMFIPGVSDESGATATTVVSEFDEGPVKFYSTHSMSIPLGTPLRNTMLRVAIFAKITTMHLEKLISWDDMRDHKSTSPKKKRGARLNETEFYTEERHDVFSKVQILELSETGEYLPVEVVQSSDIDPGSFQLRQGLQRRVQLSLTHSSREALRWGDITHIRMGQVRLLDPRGKMPDLSSPTREIRLNSVLGPVIKTNADGTSTVTVVAQWDSSLHNSILLDRTTADKYRVQMSLRWNVTSDRLSEPIAFSQDIFSQVQPRVVRSPSKFMQLWTNNRIMHSGVGLFQLVIRPAAARRAGDLWRMNTLHRYVKGEEHLGQWTPRGVSLVRDFLRARKRRIRVAEVEDAKGFLSSLPITKNGSPLTLKPVLAEEVAQLDPALGSPMGLGVTGVNGLTKTSILGEGEASLAPDEPTPEDGKVVDDAQKVSSPKVKTEPVKLIGPAESVGSVKSIETAEDVARGITTVKNITPVPEEDPQTQVLRKFVKLWPSGKDPSEVGYRNIYRPFIAVQHANTGMQRILVRQNTEPPQNGACFAESTEAEPPRLIAEVRQIPKRYAEVYYTASVLLPNIFIVHRR